MFDLQGHRGARGRFPENTLEGFVATMQLGIDSFEIDVAITRDGVPVLHHDTALNPDIARLGDVWLAERGPLIRDLTLVELAAYDVGRLRPGSTYAQTYATQVPQDGARIPTLESVLALPARHFNIELKLHPEWTVSAEEMVERVLHVVNRVDAAERVTLQSFDWSAPRYVRRLRPSLRRGWLSEGAPETAPEAIAAEGGGTWTPFHANLTQALLARAHGLRLLVIPWTVNEAPDIHRLVDWGVDGLISDWPERGLAWRARA